MERDHWKFKDRDETKNRSFVEKPLFVFNFMDFVFIARDHMRMYLMATRPWICISTTKKACERSLVADDEEKS